MINHHVDDLLATQEVAARAARELGDPVQEAMSRRHLALTNYVACRYRVELEHAMRGGGGAMHERLGEHAEALTSLHHETALALATRIEYRREIDRAQAALGG